MAKKLRPIPMKPDLLRLNGISEQQITEHFEILYKGYVSKVNEISEKLPEADWDEANPTYSEIRELKLEETFARNGVVLHELYFLNLEANGRPDRSLMDAITRSFTSYKAWDSHFRATGLAARGGLY